MNARCSAFLILFSGLFHPSTTIGAEIAWTDITVRIYDATELGQSDMRIALRVAATTLASAEVHVTWYECPASTAGSAGRCDAPLGTRELAIRIVRSPARIDDLRTTALGDAFVDTRAGQGVLATLYADRVQRLADAAGTDAATLLGRALAHELGHLLVATNAHSTFGLMRAVWSRDEIRRSSQFDWAFTKLDVDRIQRRARAIR
jgi:hypothetical protein